MLVKARRRWGPPARGRVLARTRSCALHRLTSHIPKISDGLEPQALADPVEVVGRSRGGPVRTRRLGVRNESGPERWWYTDPALETVLPKQEPAPCQRYHARS